MPPYGYRKFRNRICSVEGCEQLSKYTGLCGMHYKRRWRHGDVNTSIIPHVFIPTECEVEGCNSSTVASNTPYCKVHEQRLRRYGRLFNIKSDYGTGSNHVNAGGYKVVTIDGVTNYEHIFLAEKALGRKLPEGAVVHHMNGNPLDNYTRFNLVICPNQSYHMLLHKRMRDMGYEKETIEGLDL